jgi:hypothetical protein
MNDISQLNEYNHDQLESLSMVRRSLQAFSEIQLRQLKEEVQDYLRFREKVAAFQRRHFSEVCTEKCFTDNTSACCGREGIMTFFADVVINSLVSSEEELERIEKRLFMDPGGFKCVYLTPEGCLWRLKPIVCEMFLCAHAKKAVLGRVEGLQKAWEALRREERTYTWPDRPVLFDAIEERFMEEGLNSPLMYFHLSPGLLRVKSRRRPPSVKAQQTIAPHASPPLQK